jgi:hypothetical protein
MGKVLGIVYRTLATHIAKKAGYNKQTAQTGAVTLIQRFGSALNLNIHFHMLYLDGVYAEDNYGKTRFHPIKAPTKSELNSLTHRISQRVAGFLEREGLLVRDDDNDYLALDGLEDDPMLQIQGYSLLIASLQANSKEERSLPCKLLHLWQSKSLRQAVPQMWQGSVSMQVS